jgi:hypothetical protein
MLQTSGNPHKNESVKTQQGLHGKTEEIYNEKEKELERLKLEIEIKVKILKELVEVRNFSDTKVCFTLTSWEL